MEDIKKLYFELSKLGQIKKNVKKTGYFINDPHFSDNYFETGS